MLLLLVSSLSGVHAARAGEFTVIDGRAPQEISEVSRVYVDGELAATFRLNESLPGAKAKITTRPGSTTHSYALCGEITIRRADGQPETHEVSSAGTLNNPDGHVLEALGAADFTEFYLLDPDDAGVATHQRGRAEICAAPVS